jgi:hypothetical protein
MILAGITSVYQQGGAKRKHMWDEHATNKFRINPTGPTSVSMKPLPDYKPTGYNIKRGVERPINFDDLFRNKNVNQQLAQKFPQYVSNPGMGAMNITTLPTTGSMPAIPPVDTKPIKEDSEDVFYDAEDVFYDAEDFDIISVKEEVKEEKGIFLKALEFISETFFEKDDSTDNSDPDYEPSSSDAASNFSKTLIDEFNQLQGERKENLKQLVLSIAKKYVDEQKQKEVKTILEKPKISKKDSKQLNLVLDPFIAKQINENLKKGFRLSSRKDRENQQNSLKSFFDKISEKQDSLGNFKNPNFNSKSTMPDVVATANETSTGADTNFKMPQDIGRKTNAQTLKTIDNVVAPKNQTSTESSLSPISEETIELGSGTMNPKTYNPNNLNDVQEIADRFPGGVTSYLNEQIAFRNAAKNNLEQEKKNAKYDLDRRVAASKAIARQAERKVIKKKVGVQKLEPTKSMGDPTSTESLSPTERIISSKRKVKTPPKKPTFTENPGQGISTDFRSDFQKNMDYINAPLSSPDSSGSEYGVKGKGKKGKGKGKGKKK